VKYKKQPANPRYADRPPDKVSDIVLPDLVMAVNTIVCRPKVFNGAACHEWDLALHRQHLKRSLEGRSAAYEEGLVFRRKS